MLLRAIGFLALIASVSTASADEKDKPKIALPEGHKLYSLEIHQQTAMKIGKLIQPGVKVSVTRVERGADNKPKSVVVVDDVLIVAVNNPEANGKKGEFVVALAVKPADAKKLADADKKGSLHIHLKPVKDDKK